MHHGPHASALPPSSKRLLRLVRAHIALSCQTVHAHSIFKHLDALPSAPKLPSSHGHPHRASPSPRRARLAMPRRALPRRVMFGVIVPRSVHTLSKPLSSGAHQSYTRLPSTFLLVVPHRESKGHLPHLSHPTLPWRPGSSTLMRVALPLCRTRFASPCYALVDQQLASCCQLLLPSYPLPMVRCFPPTRWHDRCARRDGEDT